MLISNVISLKMSEPTDRGACVKFFFEQCLHMVTNCFLSWLTFPSLLHGCLLIQHPVWPFRRNVNPTKPNRLFLQHELWIPESSNLSAENLMQSP